VLVHLAAAVLPCLQASARARRPKPAARLRQLHTIAGGGWRPRGSSRRDGSDSGSGWESSDIDVDVGDTAAPEAGQEHTMQLLMTPANISQLLKRGAGAVAERGSRRPAAAASRAPRGSGRAHDLAEVAGEAAGVDALTPIRGCGALVSLWRPQLHLVGRGSTGSSSGLAAQEEVPAGVAAAMELIRSLMFLAGAGAQLPPNAAAALLLRFSAQEAQDAFEGLRLLGWVNGTARRAWQLSRAFHHRLRGEPALQLLQQRAPVVARALQAALAAADSGMEVDGDGDGGGAGQQPSAAQQLRPHAGGGVSVVAGTRAQPTSGVLVAQILVQAAGGELALLPDVAAAEQAQPGDDHHSADAPSGLGVVVQQADPSSADWSSRSAQHDLFAYVAGQAAAPAREAAVTSKRARGAAGAKQPAPGARPAASESVAAAPLFPPHEVGASSSRRAEVEAACLAAAQQLDLGLEQGSPGRAAKQRRMQGSTVAAASDAGAAAVEPRAAVAAALSLLRDAGHDGLPAGQVASRLRAQLQPEAAAAASDGGGVDYGPGPASHWQAAAGACLQHLVGYGLVRRVAGWAAHMYAASEHSQRFLVHPQPQQGCAPAALPAGAAGAAGGQQGAAEPLLQEQQAAGGSAQAPRGDGTAAAPAAAAVGQQAGGPELLIKPWLDHRGHLNRPLYGALTQKAVNVALRNPGGWGRDCLGPRGVRSVTSLGPTHPLAGALAWAHRWRSRRGACSSPQPGWSCRPRLQQAHPPCVGCCCPAGIPEPLLVDQLNIICPSNAALLLGELVQQGVLMARRQAAPVVAPPRLLLGRRRPGEGTPDGGGGGGGGSSSTEGVCHYYPALSKCLVAHETACPRLFVAEA